LPPTAGSQFGIAGNRLGLNGAPCDTARCSGFGNLQRVRWQQRSSSDWRQIVREPLYIIPSNALACLADRDALDWSSSTSLALSTEDRKRISERSTLRFARYHSFSAILAEVAANSLKPFFTTDEERSSNRCVFVVSSLAGIVLKLPRVSYPAKASAATRDAKCLGAGRERPQGLSRPFSSRRMWSVSAGF
jgi:hypothetical protein